MKYRLPIVNKAIAYIIKDKRLLVFTHRDAPEAGVQIPAGTIKEGERARKAVLREAYEETGLDCLRIERYLGCRFYNMSPYRPEIHRRYFYLLECTAKTRAKWTHFETHDGLSEPTAFCFYWVNLSLDLIAGQGDLLGRVKSL